MAKGLIGSWDVTVTFRLRMDNMPKAQAEAIGAASCSVGSLALQYVKDWGVEAKPAGSGIGLVTELPGGGGGGVSRG